MHLTIELVSCFYNLISLHSSSSSWVPILVSDPLWTTKSFVGLLSDSVLHIWSPCEFFPWYIMPLLSCILCLANHALLSGLCYLLLKLVVYVSKKPLWVEHMPSLNRVNPKVFTSLTLLVLHQIKFQHCIFIEREKWMKGYALEKWESTLNLCSCPWTRCRSYH